MLVGREKEWNNYKDQNSYQEKKKLIIKGKNELIKLGHEIVVFGIVFGKFQGWP
jgi:hypothetical protein